MIFTIFSILSLVCILISTFGIYSLVSLATEQRRKEIAIRKVNGATFYHILQLFFREYFILVTLGNVFCSSSRLLGYKTLARDIRQPYHIAGRIVPVGFPYHLWDRAALYIPSGQKGSRHQSGRGNQNGIIKTKHNNDKNITSCSNTT